MDLLQVKIIPVLVMVCMHISKYLTAEIRKQTNNIEGLEVTVTWKADEAS